MIYEALRTSPLIILLRAVVHFGGGGTSYEPHKTRYILPLVISHSTWRQPSLLFPSPRLVFEDSRRPRVYLNAHRSPDIFIYRQAWQHRRRPLRPLSSSFLRAPLREGRGGETAICYNLLYRYAFRCLRCWPTPTQPPRFPPFSFFLLLFLLPLFPSLRYSVLRLDNRSPLVSIFFVAVERDDVPGFSCDHRTIAL